jgi:hypothetical protein
VLALFKVEDAFTVQQPPSLVILEKQEFCGSARHELWNQGTKQSLIDPDLMMNYLIGSFPTAVLSRCER